MVCSSSPHSQAAEGAMPHLCKQERKRPTPVRRRFSRTHAWQGDSRSVGSDVGDESAESCSVLQPLHIPSVIRPERCTSVVAIR